MEAWIPERSGAVAVERVSAKVVSSPAPVSSPPVTLGLDGGESCHSATHPLSFNSTTLELHIANCTMCSAHSILEQHTSECTEHTDKTLHTVDSIPNTTHCLPIWGTLFIEP